MNIEQKVKDILSKLSGEEVVSCDTSLQNDLALDSLSLVTLLIEIEDSFNFQLHEADMNPFDLNTVEDVINLVERYYGGENE